MLIEASPEEMRALAREAGMDLKQLAKVSRKSVDRAIEACKHQGKTEDNVIFLHKGLNSLLTMLRRRDELDESELALRADVPEEEIRRIEFDPTYLPSPRTIYKLEQAFALPSGVLAKLTGAIKHHSPEFEERALEFAANAKSIGKLTKAERELLNAYVKFITEKG